MDGSQRDSSVQAVERFVGAFHRRWPEPEEFDELVTDDVEFVERPSIVSPRGSVRNKAGMVAGSQAGRTVLAWQEYDVRDHVVEDDRVVTRFGWSGELAIDIGPWTAGTVLRAWCVAHYVVRDGRIAHVEQHDCYEPVDPG